jgi:hypothetical protein
MEFSVTKLLINNEFTIWKQLPPGSTKFSENRNFNIFEVPVFCCPGCRQKRLTTSSYCDDRCYDEERSLPDPEKEMLSDPALTNPARA